MKILVTGGAGFVGSHLAKRLLREGHDVIVVDHCEEERERFLPDAARLYMVGIGDASLADIFFTEQPDAVIHLAAQISVTASIDDPLYDAQINLIDALRVLELSVKNHVQRFIFASSGGAIYGDHPELPTTERFDALPLSPYGIAKQSFEHYLESFGHHHGLSVMALRFANLYGPHQAMSGAYAGVMPIFITRLLEGKEVTIFGDGSSTRDYVFVEDAVEAFMAALQSAEEGVVNVATGRETTVKDLWQLLRDVHGSEQEAAFAPARPGEVHRSVLSSDLAKEKLGWSPQVSLEEGVRKTYDWFKEQYAARTGTEH